MPDATGDPHPTTQLLERARGADRAALDQLLRHVWPRIVQWVRRERPEAVRGRYETLDCAQDVALGLVQYLPRVVVRDAATFDRILYRMIQNSMCAKLDYLTAQRRRIARERPLDAAIDLDPPDPAPSPSQELARREEQAWIRFSLTLLPAEEQELILRHLYGGSSFAEIAAALGQNADAIRMRCNRALAHLGALMRRLRAGEAARLFAE